MRQKQLEDLEGAAKVIVDMVDPLEAGVSTTELCWSVFVKSSREYLARSRRPPKLTWRTSSGLSSHFGPKPI
jgi:hypothetical protein